MGTIAGVSRRARRARRVWRGRRRRSFDDGSPDGAAFVGDRGQAAILLLVVAATLAVVTTAALAEFGGHVLDRSRAQHAADAAALASLDGGRRAASDLARRNDAELVSWSIGPGPHEVTVRVRVGDSTATATATDAP